MVERATKKKVKKPAVKKLTVKDLSVPLRKSGEAKGGTGASSMLNCNSYAGCGTYQCPCV